MRLWLLCVLACGCAPEPLLVTVPFEEGDQSALIAVSHRSLFEVYAVDADHREETPLLRAIEDYDGEEPIQVTALFYDYPLSEMRVVPGLVGKPAPGESRDLPTDFLRSRGAQVVEDIVIRWQEPDLLDRRLRDLELPETTPCRSFEVERFEASGERYVAGFFPLSAEEAGAITWAGDSDEPLFYRMRWSGPERLDLRIPNFFARGSVRDASGRIWVGGGEPQNSIPEHWVGDFERGFTRGTSRASLLTASVVRGFAVPDAREDATYLLDFHGRIDRFANQEWERLFQPTESVFDGRGLISWVGPKELYTVSPSGKILYRTSSGGIAEDLPDFDPAVDELTALATIPGIGTVVGTLDGYVLRHASTGWEVLRRSPMTDRAVRSFLPYQGGMLVGAGGGTILQYYPGTGFCDAVVVIGADTHVNHMSKVDGGLFVVGVRNASTGNALYFATLREDGN